ncbi:MAG: rRNA maturation RNase YbeY [bacterium]|nr:rRNA maturation RNase YbeY [bacterium]
MLSLTFSTSPTDKPRVSRVLLCKMKDAVLGKQYELSVAFVTSARMKKLNFEFRRKNTSTDILSFPLSKMSGEILFCMRDVEAQAPLFDRTSSNFLKFLFIHGLLHLKGYAHGSRMESEEEKFRKKFNI